MYFVAECITISAPNSNGRVSTGVANVESTPNRIPLRLATSAQPAMSVIDSRGLPGLSIHNSFVSGKIAASTARKSVVSTSVTVIPARSTILCNSRYVPP